MVLGIKIYAEITKKNANKDIDTWNKGWYHKRVAARHCGHEVNKTGPWKLNSANEKNQKNAILLKGRLKAI